MIEKLSVQFTFLKPDNFAFWILILEGATNERK